MPCEGELNGRGSALLIEATGTRCDSLYVEVQFLNEDGVVIGRDIASIGVLGLFQQVHAEFHTFDDEARSTRISEVSCL